MGLAGGTESGCRTAAPYCSGTTVATVQGKNVFLSCKHVVPAIMPWPLRAASAGVCNTRSYASRCIAIGHRCHRCDVPSNYDSIAISTNHKSPSLFGHVELEATRA
eukprot:691052-Pleurochrysis_carterae.AAC.2